MLENFDIHKQTQFGSITGFGMNSQATNPNITNPAMGAQINQQAITDAATDNFIGNKINEFGEVDPLVQMGVAVPVVVAMNSAMDKYLKLYDGEYSKSLPGKVGAFGDKVSNFISESRVGKFVKNNIIDKVKPLAKKHIYDNSGIVRTLHDETLSRPDLKFVANQMNPGVEHSLGQVTSAWDEFLKPLESAADLDCLGADKNFIKETEELLKSATTAEERASILLQREYKLLSPNTPKPVLDALSGMPREDQLKMLQELKAKALGFANKAEFDLIKENPSKNINRIVECLEKTDKRFFTRMSWSDANWYKKVKGNLFGRKLSFNQLRNITISSLAKEGIGGAETKFGRGLAKWVNLVTDGATNRMFAGKFAALMQAYFLAEALIMANKQETTGDKLKSFAERLVELIGFFVFIGPSIKLMHKIGDLAYAGVGKSAAERKALVARYEKAVAEFNEKVMNCSFANRKEYKAARKAVKDIIKPKSKNPITWLARKIGNMIKVGGDKTTLRGYSWGKIKQSNVDLNIANIMKNPKEFLKNLPKNLATRLKDVACNPKYWTKKFIGWPVRFLIPMMVIMPFFNKLAVKATHAVVGKPKYSILDQEKIEKEQEKAQEAQQAAQSEQAAQQTAETQKIPEVRKPKDPNSYDSDTNLIKMTANGQKITINDSKPKEDTRYIPNPQGMVPHVENTNEAEDAIAQADKVEKEIQSMLKMN